MSSAAVRALVIKARAENLRRGEADLGAGFTPPERCPLDLLLRTVQGALQAAMEERNWDAVAEAYDMACTLHRLMTGKAFDPICTT